jgi:hypothetical protein
MVSINQKLCEDNGIKQVAVYQKNGVLMVNYGGSGRN